MDQILDRLWLGNFEDAAAYAEPATQAVPIRAILTLSEALPPIAATLTHIQTAIPDEVYLAPTVWGGMVHVLTRLLHERPHPLVLVHCRLGVSRAPALVAAYLAVCGHSRDPQAALTYLVTRRGCVAPHEATFRGVLEWWGSR